MGASSISSSEFRRRSLWESPSITIFSLCLCPIEIPEASFFSCAEEEYSLRNSSTSPVVSFATGLLSMGDPFFCRNSTMESNPRLNSCMACRNLYTLSSDMFRFSISLYFFRITVRISYQIPVLGFRLLPQWSPLRGLSCGQGPQLERIEHS